MNKTKINNWLVLAGKRGHDAFLDLLGVENKSFIKIQDKYSLEWVIEGLEKACPESCRWISILENQQDLFAKNLKDFCKFKRVFTDIYSSPTRAICDVLEQIPDGEDLLVTTADNPMLKPEVIEFFLNLIKNNSCDVAIATENGIDGLFEKFPEFKNKRTWHKLNSKTFLSGANLFYFKSSKNLRENMKKIISQIEQSRKIPIKLALKATNFNLLFLIKLLARHVSIQECEEAISRACKFKVKIFTLPFIGSCMDVDKIEDYNFVTENIVL